METPPSLSTIESFSHTWLMNSTPTSESQEHHHRFSCSTSFDASDEASFIEMDPELPASRRFYRVAKDFSFDFRSFQSPVKLADADELISDGFLTCNFDHNYAETESSATPRRFMSSFSQREVNSSNRIESASLRRCKSVSKRIFEKYFDFIWPFCMKLQRRRGTRSRVASVGEKIDPCLPEAPARSAHKNWRIFCDSECPITDAVLHCKRTYGK